jgi:hypothetical protein
MFSNLSFSSSNSSKLLKLDLLKDIEDIIDKNKKDINNEVTIGHYINNISNKGVNLFEYYKNILFILEEILKIINKKANSFVNTGNLTSIQGDGDYMQKTREDTDRIFLLMNTFTDKFTDDDKIKIKNIITQIKERLFNCCKIVEKGGKTKNKKQKTKNKKQKKQIKIRVYPVHKHSIQRFQINLQTLFETNSHNQPGNINRKSKTYFT